MVIAVVFIFIISTDITFFFAISVASASAALAITTSSTLATQSEQGPSVAESTEEPLKIHWKRPGDKAMGPASHGLTYMARDQVLRLAGSCDLHHSDR
ncbi:hypothetical protein CGCVW01_v014440 [Colletotrichum viniferum]|nr:hypothetical protein CGCVW01_v014440 [Colletotrichum viniferum]